MMATSQPDPMEIDRSSIHFYIYKKKRILLGEGFFAKVYRGHWDGKDVAVKTLKSGCMKRQDFLQEAQIMKTLNHHNLIQLYAVCTNENPIYIITELMKNGSLLKYLNEDMGKTLGFDDQIKMAVQVAAGMDYLEKKLYLHRDLAARNVLVGENVYKVADFGLARVLKATPDSPTSEYYRTINDVQVPVRWTAPEAIKDNMFTIKNDVWSFGILLYEIMTFGMTPYSDMNCEQVILKVTEGYRMPSPNGCPKKMYEIMLVCWEMRANDRPSFEYLQTMLSGLQ